MPVPRQPQDHKPKTVKPKVERRADSVTVTHRGVTVVIPFEAFDDFELLEALGEMQNALVDDNKRIARLPDMFKRIFGSDSPKVLNALRDPKTGRVKIADASSFIFEVFEAVDPES